MCLPCECFSYPFHCTTSLNYGERLAAITLFAGAAIFSTKVILINDKKGISTVCLLYLLKGTPLSIVCNNMKDARSKMYSSMKLCICFKWNPLMCLAWPATADDIEIKQSFFSPAHRKIFSLAATLFPLNLLTHN